MSVLWWNERDTLTMMSRRKKTIMETEKRRLTSEKHTTHIKTSAEFQMNEWMNDEFGADICMPYYDSLTHNNKTKLASYTLIHSDSTTFNLRARVCVCVLFFWFLFIQFCYENMALVYTLTLVPIRKQVHNTLHLYKYAHLHIQLCLSLIAPRKKMNKIIWCVFLLSKIYVHTTLHEKFIFLGGIYCCSSAVYVRLHRLLAKCKIIWLSIRSQNKLKMYPK